MGRVLGAAAVVDTLNMMAFYEFNQLTCCRDSEPCSDTKGQLTSVQPTTVECSFYVTAPCQIKDP